MWNKFICTQDIFCNTRSAHDVIGYCWLCDPQPSLYFGQVYASVLYAQDSRFSCSTGRVAVSSICFCSYPAKPSFLSGRLDCREWTPTWTMPTYFSELTCSILIWRLFVFGHMGVGAPVNSSLEGVLCKSLNEWLPFAQMWVWWKLLIKVPITMSCLCSNQTYFTSARCFLINISYIVLYPCLLLRLYSCHSGGCNWF